MYEYISGRVADKTLTYAVLDCGGVGYKIHTNTYALNHMGETAKLYVYLHVREEEQTLYGFLSIEERNLFLQLIGISGIGPKVALAILSAMSANEVAAAIVTANAKAFSAVSGVGAKTAQRIILELKEKIQKTVEIDEAAISDANEGAGMTAEAVSALTALGYARGEAKKAVSSVSNVATSVEELIIMALKYLDR